MWHRLPAHYPITAVCIVADPQKCPPNFDLILKSFDRKDDCDLWAESRMRRTSRFLCFSREIPTSGRSNVLTGISVFNEKDSPSPGYTVLDRTVDTSEKALKKKQIGISMSPRDIATDAISDIMFLSKSKRAPEGYTLVGEVSGFLLCYKLGKVPLETQVFSHASPHNVMANPCRQAPLPPIPQSSKPGMKPPVKPPMAAPRVAAMTDDIKLSLNPVADVPFSLNMKHRDFANLKSKTVPEILFRSIVDIQNEYDYSFTLERSAVGKRA